MLNSCCRAYTAEPLTSPASGLFHKGQEARDTQGAGQRKVDLMVGQWLIYPCILTRFPAVVAAMCPSLESRSSPLDFHQVRPASTCQQALHLHLNLLRLPARRMEAALGNVCSTAWLRSCLGHQPAEKTRREKQKQHEMSVIRPRGPPGSSSAIS